MRSPETGDTFGVELTSVYISDRSVPDEYIPPISGPTSIPYDRAEIQLYGVRLVEAIIEKVKKASSYDKTYPLILSIYINEHRSIFMEDTDWEDIVKANEDMFDAMNPFSEIVFLNLVNGGVFYVKPKVSV